MCICITHARAHIHTEILFLIIKKNIAENSHKYVYKKVLPHPHPDFEQGTALTSIYIIAQRRRDGGGVEGVIVK